MDRIKNVYLSTYFLINLKTIKEEVVIKNFLQFLDSFINLENIEEDLKNYSNFVFELNKKGYNDFSFHLRNVFLKTIDEKIINVDLKNEIDILSSLLELDYLLIKKSMQFKYPKHAQLIEKLPIFTNSFKILEFEKNDLIEKNTIFENNRAFIFDNNLEIIPIEIKENFSFKDLKGYKEQQRVLFDNTRALLNNLKVNNILLYGDAGCGKSSSVKALLSEFEEIRIVQIFKKNIQNLDKLYEKLNNIPYKFIIFIDDITFEEDDKDISSLKALLEGSLIQCPKNSVIYATSNRRHLVKESFKTRTGDCIHLNETISEINSLSERFGISLLFQKPTNEEFIDIVLELAQDFDIDIDERHLIEKAQRMALIKGTTCPRIARQLIDNLRANIVI